MVRSAFLRLRRGFSSLSEGHRDEVVFAAICLFVFALLMVLASIMSANALEPTAGLSQDHRHAFVSGPIACLEGEAFELSAVITQDSSGAQAEGMSKGFCRRSIEQWTVDAAANGLASFREGAAHACVLARRLDRGLVLDERQWCRDITLVAAAPGHGDVVVRRPTGLP